MTANEEVFTKIAYALAGQEKPHNAKVILALSTARDIDALVNYLKLLTKEDA